MDVAGSHIIVHSNILYAQAILRLAKATEPLDAAATDAGRRVPQVPPDPVLDLTPSTSVESFEISLSFGGNDDLIPQDGRGYHNLRRGPTARNLGTLPHVANGRLAGRYGFAHRELQREPDARRLPPDLTPRIRRMLTPLDEATIPHHIDLPGWRLHPMKGDRAGQWSLRVSANWRLIFRFDDGEAVDVDLTDYH